MAKKRIGILTGGGDCPGLNAVIGFEDSFTGLVRDDYIRLRFNTVSNILTQGGTILGTSRGENLFGVSTETSKRDTPEKNRLSQVKRTIKRHHLEGIICIGGDGSLAVAHYLHKQGIPMVGVPKTIDNDVPYTDMTFGFNTAFTIATEAVDRLHSTAASHHRVMVLEVMGRKAGWIALSAGMAGGGDVILIPELPFRYEEVYRVVEKRSKLGKRFSIVVAAEGAHLHHTPSMKPGGIGLTLVERIEKETGIESRATVLGHLQRGGTPTPFDRLLATRFGHAAACLAAKGNYGKMVRLKDGLIDAISLSRVAGHPRRVPSNHPLIRAARAVGTSFGDK
jgi:ATP-dependent phosphofructokinase / diphosphate-dependent phosphofructokinase